MALMSWQYPEKPLLLCMAKSLSAMLNLTGLTGESWYEVSGM